jgi:hypothetical protein
MKQGSINKNFMMGLLIYIGIFVLAACIAKYLFKVNVLILLPSLAFLLIYIASVSLAGFTEGGAQDTLFKIWNILIILASIISIAVCMKAKIPVTAILWSLLFQVPYCFVLYYYGGIIFTHKF